MDKDKKHLISKEIRSFRDTYKVSHAFFSFVEMLIFLCLIIYIYVRAGLAVFIKVVT